MTRAIDNTQLMLATAKGDQRAFRQLAQILGNRMYHLAYRLCGYQRQIAEDIVQEALLKLWRAAPNWQPTGSIEAYASRIVYNCCMDFHRQNRMTEEIPDEIPQEDTILSSLIDKQHRHILLHAIHQLPQRQREAILLYYMGEHSQNHVAKMLGTTEKSIERLLARGREKLRNSLPQTALASHSFTDHHRPVPQAQQKTR